MNFIAIGIGAILGAWLRWLFGLWLNSIVPTLPLGTLVANLLGGYIMGLFMALVEIRGYFPPEWRLFIATGFLGALTTFSTFSAETITLFLQRQYLWMSIIIASHLAGSLLTTFLGIYTVRFFLIKD